MRHRRGTMISVLVLTLAFMGTPLAASAQMTEGSMGGQTHSEMQDTDASKSMSKEAETQGRVQKAGSTDKGTSTAPGNERGTHDDDRKLWEGSH